LSSPQNSVDNGHIQKLIEDLNNEKKRRLSLEDKLESVSNENYVQLKNELNHKSEVNSLMHKGLS